MKTKEITTRKQATKKRKRSNVRHIKAVQGSTSRTLSSSTESENEDTQTNMASPATTSEVVKIDPQNFIQCFDIALGHESIQNKLITLLKPLLEARDEEIKQIKTDLIAERDKNRILEARLDDLEQWTRKDSIIISGLSDSDRESVEVCEEKVIKLIHDIGVPLKDTDINNIHRLRPQKNGPRNIIVRLTSHKTKVAIMRNKKNLRSIKTQQNDIYINEALTTTRSKLLYEVRQFVKEKKIKNVWTKDGQILVRNKEDTKTYQIKDLKDMVKI